MDKISVWATKPKKVELLIGGKKIAMEKDKSNWWHASQPELKHYLDYAFILDGGMPLPDPRSAWQPFGIHGCSRYFDHTLFNWEDKNWLPPPLNTAVVYELHIGTFTPEGTFAEAISKLDHLINLGITHLELMPVNSFSGVRGWGYDGVDFFAPHNAYGGPEGLKNLVNVCHKKGLAVILDVVYNHLGPEGNYLENFAPYLSERYISPWGKAVNFDGRESNEVRRFFCDNAIMWLKDYHIDALRIDAIHTIIDTSAIHILEQLASEIKCAFPNLQKKLIIESDLNDPRMVKDPQIGGYGLDAQWNDDFHHALHTILTGENNGYYSDFGKIADLAKALTKIFVYDGCYSRFRRRNQGRPATGLSGSSFLAYLQNHDQIGNRALGKRINHLTSIALAKIGAAITITSPFIPMIFQGEEWGASTPFQYFTDHSDEALGKKAYQGRRREFASFGWDPKDIPDPQAVETFLRSKLRWQEIDTNQHRDLLQWYKALIALRKSFKELSDNAVENLHVGFDETEKWLMFERGNINVIANFSNLELQIQLASDKTKKILLSSDLHNYVVGKNAILQPQSVVILGA